MGLRSTHRTKRYVVEVVAQTCSAKKVPWNIWQNSQENACTRDFFKINSQEVGLLCYLKRDSCICVFHMCLTSSEQLFYRTAVNGYLCFSTNLESFTINYDLAKYLKTLTILIDFAENIWNSGVAMKQSENLIKSIIQHSFGKFFPWNSFHKWVKFPKEAWGVWYEREVWLYLHPF